MQSKELQEKEDAINKITHDHTPLLKCVLAIANKHTLISHVFDLFACMYVQLLIVENENLIFQANCQPANTQPSATVAPVVWYSINSPPHMEPHRPYLDPLYG